MIPLAPLQIRPATPSDLAAVATSIARLNAAPQSQSLHCAATAPAAVRATLRRAEDFPGGWERNFVLAINPDEEISGILGCQIAADQRLGWLWGPWLEDARRWETLLPAALLDQVRKVLPAKVQRLEAFLHVENQSGLRFLRSQGFSMGLVTHIYVAPRTETAIPAAIFPELGIAHEVAFNRLHGETFPASGSVSAAELLSGRDDEHRIFAATDGLRLLGYACVSINHAPHEGFIDYLAVRPSARGHGLGTRLLDAARQWAFGERGLPQLALCVSDWRAGARRLYEQAGFQLAASGVAARRQR